MINKTLIPNVNSGNPQNIVSGDTGQQSSNFSTPSPGMITGELALKLASAGLTDRFGKLSSDINLAEKNGKLVAILELENGNFTEIPLQDTAKGTESDQLPSGRSHDGNKFKITLRPIPSLGGDTVVLDVMPSISEQHSATYESVELLQHPGEILKYKNTGARSWNLVADLVARTSEEATNNKIIINIIRSWLMPFYGTGTARSYTSRLGAPPQIIEMTGFGSNMIGPVTCVLESFSWTFENDMDYIPTHSGEPFPVLIKASLNFKETWTPREFSNFNLLDYRAGNLPNAFVQPDGQIGGEIGSPVAELANNGISGPDGIDTSSAVSSEREITQIPGGHVATNRELRKLPDGREELTVTREFRQKFP